MGVSARKGGEEKVKRTEVEVHWEFQPEGGNRTTRMDCEHHSEGQEENTLFYIYLDAALHRSGSTTG